VTPSPGTEKPKPFPPKLEAELGLVLRPVPAIGAPPIVTDGSILRHA
jgi:hypothetical protein